MVFIYSHDIEPPPPPVCVALFLSIKVYERNIHINSSLYVPQYYINGGAAPLIRSIRLDVVYFLFHGPAFICRHIPACSENIFIRCMCIGEAQPHTHTHLYHEEFLWKFSLPETSHPHFPPIFHISFIHPFILIHFCRREGVDFMNEFSISIEWGGWIGYGNDGIERNCYHRCDKARDRLFKYFNKIMCARIMIWDGGGCGWIYREWNWVEKEWKKIRIRETLYDDACFLLTVKFPCVTRRLVHKHTACVSVYFHQTISMLHYNMEHINVVWLCVRKPYNSFTCRVLWG